MISPLLPYLLVCDGCMFMVTQRGGAAIACMHGRNALHIHACAHVEVRHRSSGQVQLQIHRHVSVGGHDSFH